MKKKIILSLLLVLLVIIVAFVLLFAIRSDYRFVLTEKLSSLSRSADVKGSDCDYIEISIDELKQLPSVTFNDSMYLINSEYVISDGYTPSISEYKDVKMSSTIISSYVLLAEAVKEKYNTSLYIISSYRTAEEQADIVDSKAEDVAASVGASEHQSGLALDVYVKGYSGSAFIKSEAGRFVNRDAYRFGFIIRYPFGKKSITGIRYEPWHIRYVGKPHAEIIYKNSLTLEEYILDFYEIGEFYEYDGYIISRQKLSQTVKIPKDFSKITVSEDNTGHIFITAKKADS